MIARAALIGLGGVCAPALAGTVGHFGFEGLTPQDLGAPLVLTDGGVTVRIETMDGSILDSPSTPGLPAGWGDRCLDIHGVGGVVITFVGGTQAFGFEFGDFASDLDAIDFALFTGEGGTGAQIDTGSYYWGGNLAVDMPSHLGFEGLGNIGSIVITGERGDAVTLLYDNLTVGAVPGPAGGTALLSGLALFGRRRRSGAF